MDPSDLPLLDRLSDSPTPLSYLEPDLAETNPTAFAQKLQVCREKPTSARYLFSPGPLLLCVSVCVLTQLCFTVFVCPSSFSCTLSAPRAGVRSC